MDRSANNVVSPGLVPCTERFLHQRFYAGSFRRVLLIGPGTKCLSAAAQLVDYLGVDRCVRLYPIEQLGVLLQVRKPCIVVEDRAVLVESPECDLTRSGNASVDAFAKTHLLDPCDDLSKGAGVWIHSSSFAVHD